MKKILIPVLLLFLFSCTDENVSFPEQSQIVGLASPVKLNVENTEIIMTDYFMDVNLIDSVSLPIGLSGQLNENKTKIVVKAESSLKPLSNLKVWISNYPYSIPVFKSKKTKIDFHFNPAGKEYKKVQIAGDINGWNPAVTNLELIDGTWQTTLVLDPGNYMYQIVADDAWILDFNNPDSVVSPVSGYNSLLNVGGNEGTSTPNLSTIKTEENHILINFTNTIENVLIYWQNYLIPKEQILLDNNAITFTIPKESNKTKRSFIRIWASNSSGYSNDLLIPLNKGKVVQDVNELNREDWEASVFYFLMIDRFNNGDTKNDFPVEDPEILPKANYYGGDLAGVTQKIRDGYFSDLGINTIWLSPVAQNPLGAYGLWPEPRTKFSGYHGYWPISSSKVDYRFGTNEELEELISVAHENNFNVVLDYVANHVHELHPVYQNHPDWATDLYLPDGSLNTEKWDEERLTTWFDTFLPTIDLENPEVVDVMTDSAIFWMQNFAIDGFRHDATKHISELFWRELTKKLKENVSIPLNKRIYQVGETYGNRELIGSYVSTGMIDAQFDFNVYDKSVAAFAKDDESLINLANSLQESINHYGYHNLMGYITGNQDRPRFISLAGGDLTFGEDTKLAGWTREIGVGNPVSYKKLHSLIAFNMTIPGIPTIYYGDEYGVPGGNDPDNRRMMQFDGLDEQEKTTKDITKKLVNLRRSNLSLIYGDYELLSAEDNSLIYSRGYFDSVAIVLFNKSSVPKTLNFNLPERYDLNNLQSQFGQDIKIIDNSVEIELPANSFDVLIN